MIAHGLDLAEALTAATATASHVVGLGDRVGTVERAKVADLLVIHGDPVADPAVVVDRDRIWRVMDERGTRHVADETFEEQPCGSTPSLIG